MRSINQHISQSVCLYEKGSLCDFAIVQEHKTKEVNSSDLTKEGFISWLTTSKEGCANQRCHTCGFIAIIAKKGMTYRIRMSNNNENK